MEIKLRLATPDDKEYLFTLRNDEVTRQMSKSQTIVSWQEHCEWIDKIFRMQSESIFIAMRNCDRVGMFRVSNVGIISIAVAPKFRGMGLMRPILLKGIDKARELLAIDHLTAHVRSDNARSLNGFKAAKFAKQRDFMADGVSFVEFRLNIGSAGHR